MFFFILMRKTNWFEASFSDGMIDTLLRNRQISIGRGCPLLRTLGLLREWPDKIAHTGGRRCRQAKEPRPVQTGRGFFMPWPFRANLFNSPNKRSAEREHLRSG